ncbi:hypothetical protein HMF8227_02693 [Saliniradius amylolyticus]|uniref:Uncharacterized protein n=1 Tax=Saliniradius amylolyticus TaxID=2183582 RepID=A0A2S2E652_9ALTE|nr:efflux RND transporter periplasmic adaptor subunit [Saliniradius amylolyticus]AWL13145.1 hypothetical protein HMF8227_02693 [Saliniradius amylolyticus]
MRTLTVLVISMLLVGTAAAAPGAHGPNGEHIRPDDKPVGGTGRQADGSVILPMPDQAKLGISTAFVQPQTVSKTVRLPAVVRPHPQGHAVIQSSSDGRFEAPGSVVLSTGSWVSAGQRLGYVHYQDTAYELASQNSELKVVRNQIAQTRRDVARLKALGELASQQELDQLQTRLKNLSEQEAALQQGLEKPEVLTAPISGIVVNQQVRSGQWVEAGTALFEIVSPERRRVEAMASDTNRLNQYTSARLLAHDLPELTYTGYSPKMHGGTAKVFFDYQRQNPGEPPLLLDQPVTLLAKLDESVTGIVVPSRAVVRDQANLPIVWIKVSAERFLPQQIQYQALGPDRVVITQGLGADNRVVVNGTSLLNQVR